MTYCCTQLSKYTSFQVHAAGTVTDSSVGSSPCPYTSLRCQLRRGIPVMTHHSAHMTEMQFMLRSSVISQSYEFII